MDESAFDKAVRRYEKQIEQLKRIANDLYYCTKQPKCVNCERYLEGRCDHRKMTDRFNTTMEMMR